MPIYQYPRVEDMNQGGEAILATHSQNGAHPRFERYDARPGEYPYRLVLYEGRVLCTRERNGYHDSDFYAVVYDDKADKLRMVTYGTTRCYSTGHASTDATEEVRERAAAANFRSIYKRALRKFRKQYLSMARTPEINKRVEVVRGRKVPVGTVGFSSSVFRGSYNDSVHIDCDDGTRHWFVNIANVRVVDPEGYMPEQSEITKRALGYAEAYKRQWHRDFVPYGYISL